MQTGKEGTLYSVREYAYDRYVGIKLCEQLRRKPWGPIRTLLIWLSKVDNFANLGRLRMFRSS